MLRVVSPLALGLVAAALATAPAAAAPAQLRLAGPAAEALRASGVRLTAHGPGATSGTRLRLLAGDLVRDAGASYVVLTGELRARAGRRTVRLTGLELQLTGFAHLSARVGQRRVALLALDRRSGNWSIAGDRAAVRGAVATLTRAGAGALRQRLRLRRSAIVAGALGRLTVRARAAAPVPPPVALPADAPAGARAITGGEVRWAPRPSWLRYLRQAEGAGAESGAAFDGTTYALPIAGGWYDAPSGSAVVRTTGTTTFRYAARGLDIALGAWTYELTSAAGVASAVVERARHLSESADPSLVGQRTTVLALDPARLTPTAGDDGASVSWTAVPLTLADPGTAIFNAYPPGSEQGTVTIAATLAPAG